MKRFYTEETSLSTSKTFYSKDFQWDYFRFIYILNKTRQNSWKIILNDSDKEIQVDTWIKLKGVRVWKLEIKPETSGISDTLLIFLAPELSDVETFRQYPVEYSSSVIELESDSLNAGDSAIVVNISNKKGKMHGFNCEWDGVSPAYFWIKIEVDGTTIIDLSGAGILNVLGSSPPPDFGGGKPLAMIKYDSTNNIYAFSWTAPISFKKSLKITIKNVHTTDSMNYAFLHSTEIWEG